MSRGERLLLATFNPDKQARLRWVVEGLAFEPALPPAEWRAEQPHEGGSSHAQNAAAKACWWSARCGGLALSSDGGVRIPALRSAWHSVTTRRASGAANDAERVADLLGRLAGLAGARRDAWWIEALALADNGELLGTWEAGGPRLRIAARPSGERPEGGFWLATLLTDLATGRALVDMQPVELRRLDRAWRTVRLCARRCLRARQAGQS